MISAFLLSSFFDSFVRSSLSSPILLPSPPFFEDCTVLSTRFSAITGITGVSVLLINLEGSSWNGPVDEAGNDTGMVSLLLINLEQSSWNGPVDEAAITGVSLLLINLELWFWSGPVDDNVKETGKTGVELSS